ncbi:hypothetical protein BCY86_00595 [Pajaroellobacter abortibovis]|uniref:Uncharacterized protein n=1 Tax=Pajaroellobacter abortibovis TaxID=1882918 RepID=A0A1L6MUZ9_9BACT|nr:hypothetical protein BCY86_00595 [Pajaroellobacter abortibovis]
MKRTLFRNLFPFTLLYSREIYAQTIPPHLNVFPPQKKTLKKDTEQRAKDTFDRQPMELLQGVQRSLSHN